MKKVFTLTLVNTPNYGALLQAYALKEYIKTRDCNVKIINYYNKRTKYSQVSGLRKIRSFVWNIVNQLFFKNRKRIVITKEFKNKYCGIDNIAKTSLEELQSLNNTADVFVVGSDQVWNEAIIANDDAYFLSFTEKKKIAYAASFGSNAVSKSYLMDHEKQLEKFYAISVRELSGMKILRKQLGIHSTLVVDPVFLLSRKEWEEKLELGSLNVTEKKYVLCYVMPGDKQVVRRILSIAKKFAEKIDAGVIVIGEKSYKIGGSRIFYDHSAGPIEFVNYVRNADYVVTNSFHGTAFSVIFQKNFYSVLRKQAFSRNTRIEGLLKNIGLLEQLIYTDEFSENTVELPSIVYAEANAILKRDISNSKDFLEKSLAD